MLTTKTYFYNIIQIFELYTKFKLDILTINRISLALEKYLICEFNGVIDAIKKLHNDLIIEKIDIILISNIVKILLDEKEDDIKCLFVKKYINIYCKYQIFKFQISKQTFNLFKIYDHNNIYERLIYHLSFMTKINGNTINFSGIQLSILQSHFDFLYTNFNVRNEAFTSPFSTKIIDEGNYYSIFDEDNILGSSGNFLNMTNFPSGNWIVTPPFIDCIINKAVKKCFEILDKKEIVYIFFIMPEWKKSKAYCDLINNKFLQKMYNIPSKY